MSRKEILEHMGFKIPEETKKRVLIHTDLAAEADDYFAVVQHLLSPTEEIVGIIAGNFEWRFRTIPQLKEARLKSMEHSYHEIKKLLKLLHMEEIPVFKGAPDRMYNTDEIPVSEGSCAIIQESLRPNDKPLYIALQGSLTDLAAAYLLEPSIAQHITAAIWIGGGPYPSGGEESNLRQDPLSANIVFQSPINLWQIPINTYSSVGMTFAQLNAQVKPLGTPGKFLTENLFAVNDFFESLHTPLLKPRAEFWCLGDQPTVSALLESEAGRKTHMEKAPIITEDMLYQPNAEGKDILVFDDIDKSLLFDDFCAKLKLFSQINDI